MAGLFLMFLMTFALGELLSGYLKAPEESDDSDAPLKITFNPDDAALDWEEARKKL